MQINESTLDKALRYLEQQRQMNGNLLFKEPKRTAAHEAHTQSASVEKHAKATVKQNELLSKYKVDASAMSMNEAATVISAIAKKYNKVMIMDRVSYEEQELVVTMYDETGK